MYIIYIWTVVYLDYSGLIKLSTWVFYIWKNGISTALSSSQHIHFIYKQQNLNKSGDNNSEHVHFIYMNSSIWIRPVLLNCQHVHFIYMSSSSWISPALLNFKYVHFIYMNRSFRIRTNFFSSFYQLPVLTLLQQPCFCDNWIGSAKWTYIKSSTWIGPAL